MPGQERFFHFQTVRQLQTRLADIGMAAQRLEETNAAGKALPAPVILTRDEQAALAQKQLAEIAERRAKAKAGKQ